LIIGDLVCSYRSGEKEFGCDTRSDGTSPKQEDWSLRQEFSAAV
jgi:hypothetical protein